MNVFAFSAGCLNGDPLLHFSRLETRGQVSSKRVGTHNSEDNNPLFTRDWTSPTHPTSPSFVLGNALWRDRYRYSGHALHHDHRCALFSCNQVTPMHGLIYRIDAKQVADKIDYFAKTRSMPRWHIASLCRSLAVRIPQPLAKCVGNNGLQIVPRGYQAWGGPPRDPFRSTGPDCSHLPAGGLTDVHTPKNFLTACTTNDAEKIWRQGLR
jgi:hypothetical protein